MSAETAKRRGESLSRRKWIWISWCAVIIYGEGGVMRNDKGHITTRLCTALGNKVGPSWIGSLINEHPDLFTVVYTGKPGSHWRSITLTDKGIKLAERYMDARDSRYSSFIPHGYIECPQCTRILNNKNPSNLQIHLEQHCPANHPVVIVQQKTVTASSDNVVETPPEVADVEWSNVEGSGMMEVHVYPDTGEPDEALVAWHLLEQATAAIQADTKLRGEIEFLNKKLDELRDEHRQDLKDTNAGWQERYDDLEKQATEIAQELVRMRSDNERLGRELEKLGRRRGVKVGDQLSPTARDILKRTRDQIRGAS